MQLTWILGSLIFLAVVTIQVQRGRIGERYAIWWAVAGLVALITSIFPALLIWGATLVGVETPSNLAFFLAIICLALVNLQLSAELTKLKHRERSIVEELALLEARVRD